MENSQKKIPVKDWKRIQKIYENHDTSIFPKILSYVKVKNSFIVKFEWIPGKNVSSDDLSDAFYTLGEYHKKNTFRKCENGFITICHGDTHLNNIIKTLGGDFKFIDVTYLHEGINFSDLEYIDFFDLYDKKDYPWMIKEIKVFDDYLSGAEISVSEKEKEKIKKSITINYLKKCIRNGEKFGIDSKKEEISLKKIQRKGYI